jgi:hypothetical protein
MMTAWSVKNFECDASLCVCIQHKIQIFILFFTSLLARELYAERKFWRLSCLFGLSWFFFSPHDKTERQTELSLPLSYCGTYEVGS